MIAINCRSMSANCSRDHAASEPESATLRSRRDPEEGGVGIAAEGEPGSGECCELEAANGGEPEAAKGGELEAANSGEPEAG
jgi:hypothetical protein